MIGSDLDCEFYIIKGISKRFTTKEKTDFCSYFEPKECENCAGLVDDECLKENK